MPSKSKSAGDRWERTVCEKLNGKRQPSSGAFGSIHNNSSLVGDVVINLPWLSKPILVECKYGYGGSTQLSLKRDWFTKVRKQAEAARRFPAVAIKFRDVTSGDIGSSEVICFNFDTWKKIIDEINAVFMQNLTLLEEKFKGVENGSR